MNHYDVINQNVNIEQRTDSADWVTGGSVRSNS